MAVKHGYLSTKVKPYTIVATDDDIKEIVDKEMKRLGNAAILDHIDVSGVYCMKDLFADTDFCGDISKWDVSKVEDMTGMFRNCRGFNGNLTTWKLNKRCKTDGMFSGCLIDEKNKPEGLRLEGESGSTQIKIFNSEKSTPDCKEIEKEVNAFLVEHKDKMKVKDIKYSATEPNTGNPLWKNWTVMVIYDVI
jgi:hypothetical protein